MNIPRNARRIACGVHTAHHHENVDNRDGEGVLASYSSLLIHLRNHSSVLEGYLSLFSHQNQKQWFDCAPSLF